MLSTLPNEILEEICDHVDERRDISNLAKCCRKFHHLLNPRIYESLEFSGSSLWSVSRLVRTLIENPSWAQYVYSLSLGEASGVEYESVDKVIYDADIMKPVLERLCCSREEEVAWSKALQEVDEQELDQVDPWEALLLTMLPKLQELSIRFDWPAEYTLRVLKRAALRPQLLGDTPLFPDLRDISVSWWDTENGVRSSHVLLFFRFPSVSKISGVMIVDDGIDDADSEEFASSSLPSSGYSNVTEIDFRTSNSGLGFPKLLNACAKLEHFSYLHAGAIVGDGDFNPPVFLASLVRHKESLQTLTLVFDTEAGHYPIGATSDDTFLGSLREFTSLKTVRLRAPNVLDVGDRRRGPVRTPLMDTLPPSLQKLCLEDVEDCDLKLLLSELEKVVENVRTVVPHLTSVKLVGRLHEQEPINFLTWASQPHYVAAPRKVPTIKTDIIEASARLRWLCSENGIDFKLRDPAITSAIAHNKRWGHAYTLT